MIGAGTGLGFGYLVKNNNSKYYEVYASEGGHQDFAPQNETEWEFFKYLQ
jgi:glucokinase